MFRGLTKVAKPPSLEYAAQYLISSAAVKGGIVIVLTTIFLLHATVPRTMPNRVLSYLINLFLCWRFPIYSKDGRTKLPTVPYTSPNGQGNDGKFIESGGPVVWRKIHGPVYRIWSGFTPEIVLTCPEHIQEVFKDSNLHLKAKNSNLGWLFGELLGECLGFLNLGDWSRVLSPFAGIFHKATAKTYIHLIQKRLEDTFRSPEKSSPRRGKHLLIRPSEDLKHLPFFIMGEILYGEFTENMEAELREIILLREKVWEDVLKGGFSRFSVSRILPTSTNRNLRLFKRKWSVFNKNARRLAEARPSKVIAPIARFYTAVEQRQMSETQLLQTLDEVLFGNLDLVTGTFSWIPTFLAANKYTQKELRLEICQAREKVSAHEWAGYLSSNSTLLMACILESARLRPTMAFSVQQAAPTDRTIEDFVIPAGTNFLVDIHALNISDPYWGPDNTSYRPKRFLEARNLTDERYRFFRFGFGPRQCLGKHVVDLYMKMALIYMVENFQLSLEEENVPENLGSKTDSWVSCYTGEIWCEEI